MANFVNTKPQALRGIASSIVTHSILQTRTLTDCLNVLAAETGEIEIQSYQMNVEAISAHVRRMEELQGDIKRFADILNQKAAELDALGKK